MSGDGPTQKESPTMADEGKQEEGESKKDSASTLIVTSEDSVDQKKETEVPVDFEKLAVEDTGEEDKDEDDKVYKESKEKVKEYQLEDDFVDEEALKAEEEKLTPEELSERLSKAKTHKDTGNAEFKEEKYKESILSYTQGLLVCPLCEKELRSILYANRAVAKMKLSFKDLAVMDCTKSLEYNPSYMKALIRRAALYEELDKLDEALEDYKKILEIDPTYRDAIVATQRLPPLINERNEKLKAEMMGKLKDLGNLVLRPFGLSTENFQLEQQEGGGYSINFKK